MEEYFVYFPFFKPQTGGKRSAIQPQTIYSEFPKLLSYYYTDFLRRINWIMIKVSLNLPQGSDNSGKSRKKAHRKSGALRLSKNHVIASQCSHWRGNPPDIQIFSILNQQLLRSTGGFPHQSAIYYGMIATGNHHYFNSLRGAPLVRNDTVSFGLF